MAIAEGSTVAEAARRIGVTDPIRSDNGPEFTARAVSEWLGRVGARTLCMSLDRRGRTACEFQREVEGRTAG